MNPPPGKESGGGGRIDRKEVRLHPRRTAPAGKKALKKKLTGSNIRALHKIFQRPVRLRNTGPVNLKEKKQNKKGGGQSKHSTATRGENRIYSSLGACVGSCPKEEFTEKSLSNSGVKGAAKASLGHRPS